jgi:SnoaL-like domain
MDAADTRDATATWVDKLAVQELIHRYADGVNRADWNQVRGVFAPQAVWEAPAFGLHFGTAEEFCDFLAQTQTSSQLLVQTTHATVVRLTSPDAATATTTIHEISLGTNLVDGALGDAGDEINMEDYGIYYDAAERIGGEWLFVHRMFMPLYAHIGCVTGNVVTGRDQLLQQRPAHR